MILYKYRNNSDYTNKIFVDKKVWLSNAAGLNDPFECTIQKIAGDWIEKKVKDLKTGHIEGFLMSAFNFLNGQSHFYGFDKKQTKEFLKKFGQKDFDAQYRTVREFIFRKTGNEISNPEETFANFDKQLNEVGIFSLTETCENQLMWAHYADSSRGIAIGYEAIVGSKLANEEHCVKVNYSDELPAFKGGGLNIETLFYAKGKNTQKIAFIDKTFRQAVSTKPTCWEYEKEWRYIEEKSGSYIFPGKLNEIVFGLKCPKEIRVNYVQLIVENFNEEIDFFEIATIPDTNKLIKVQYKF